MSERPWTRSLRTALVAAVAAHAALAQTPRPGPRRPFDIETQMRLRSVVDVALSPDARRVAYVIDSVDAVGDRHVRRLRVRNANATPPGPTAQEWAVNGDQPRWSPDSRSLAFIADCDGSPQLWIATLPDAPRCMTHLAGGVEDAAWAGDGARIAVLAADASPPAPSPAARVITEARSGPATHLHIVSVADGTVHRLTSGPYTIDELSWAPDGLAIAVTIRADSGTGSDLLNSDLAVVRVADGAVRMLVQRPGMDATPRWSPDGRQIAFITHGGRREYLGDTFVSVVPASGGTVRDLTPWIGERQLPGEFTLEWAPDGRSLMLSAPRAQGTVLFEIDAATGRGRERSTDTTPRNAFSFSADGRTMAFLGTGPAMAWEAFVSRVDSFVPRRLTVSNPVLDSVALGRMSEARWRAPDGTMIDGVLLVPPGHHDGQRHPTILFLHGGPAWSFVLGFAPQGILPKGVQSDFYSVQVLASLGFAVLMPNPRGSIGRGHDFRLANVADWGGADLDDDLAGIDWLIAQGVADSTRLGVMGHSYGGTAAAMAIARTRRFRAAAIGAPVFDPTAFYGASDLPELVAGYYGGPPSDTTLIAYRRNAVSHWIAAARTPAILFHGEADRRVPPAQSRALYRALRDAGVETELVVYPAQGHGLTRPSFQRDAALRVVAWMTTRLMPQP